LAGAIITAISAFRAIPIYRASAKLLIDRAAPQVVKVPEVLPTEAAEATDYYPTQYGILKSLSLAREVVTQLSLQQHPEFVGRPEEKSFDLLGSIQGGLQRLLEGIGIAPAGSGGTPPSPAELARRSPRSSLPSWAVCRSNPSAIAAW
jgi:uncharacterized protein involved in exopolysaccharide biosynthesis